MASLHVWYPHRWHRTACDTLHHPQPCPGAGKPLLGSRKGLLSLPSSPAGPGSFLQLSEHGTEDRSGMKGLCGHFQPINRGSKQPCWQPGWGLGLNDQRELCGSKVRAECNTYPLKGIQVVPYFYKSLLFRRGFSPGWGSRALCEITALLDGNGGTPQPLPPPRWSSVSSCFPEAGRLHSVTQRCILPQALQPGSSSALLSWWRAERALGLSLFIAEGSWDATILLIYTLGERWLVFWETSHMAESPCSGLLFWP